jgi:hypothetical protein
MDRSHRHKMGTLILQLRQQHPNKSFSVIWKIQTNDTILPRAMKWYDYALSHIGQNWLADTMSMTFYNPKLQNGIEVVVSPCKECQKYQKSNMDTGPKTNLSSPME